MISLTAVRRCMLPLDYCVIVAEKPAVIVQKTFSRIYLLGNGTDLNERIWQRDGVGKE